MYRILLLTFFLGLVVLVPSGFAQELDTGTVLTDPGSTLSPSPNSIAVQTINRLFGQGWNNLYYEAGENNDNALFQMLSAFNVVVLAGAALMFMYIIGQGLIGTAHEGEPMGKKFSTVWTPLRSTFAVALMVPLPWAKGLSMIQALVLAFVYWGIGGADFIWVKSLDYMQDNAGHVTPLTNFDKPEQLVRGALLTQVVRHYMAVHEDKSSEIDVEFINDSTGEYADDGTWASPGKWQIVVNTDEGESSGWWGSFKSKKVNEHTFGSFEVPCSRIDDPICEARKDAVLGLLADTDSLAADIVSSLPPPGTEGDIGEMEGMLSSLALDSFGPIVSSYNEDVYNAITNDFENYEAEYADALEEFTLLAKDKGWAFAGAWYWTIARFQKEAGERVSDFPKYSDPDYEKILDMASADLKPLIGVAETFVDQSISKMQDVARGPGQEGIMGKITSAIGKPFSIINPVETLGLNEDPILAMQGIGNTIINSSMVIFAGMLASKYIAVGGDAAAGTISWIPGIGTGAKTATKVALAMLKDLISLTSILLIPLFVFAMVLAYYLPSVPFILFTSAFIGWLILVFESVVAAPLWAASHIDGSDEGLTGQKGKTGYMLFLGILFRPSLMIIGFMASYLLFAAIGQILYESLSVFAAGLRGNSPSGLITLIAFIIIAGSLTIIYAHKLFGLVTWMPDNVMRWIGQQIGNLGENQDEATAKGNFVAAGGMVYSSSSKAAQALGGSKAGKNSSGGPGGGKGGKDTEKALAPGDSTNSSGGGQGGSSGGSGGSGGKRVDKDLSQGDIRQSKA